MARDDDIELHAYVDGELSPEHRADVLDAMQRDSQLARKVCEINNQKAQVRLAYANPPGLTACNVARRHTPWRSLAAGFALLATGIASGWMLHAQMPDAQRLVVLDADGRGQAPAVAEDEETRIVVQITQPDQEVDREVLDDIEQMLVAYRDEGRPLRVEIVTHGDGIDLLRENLSQHKQRIGQLAQRFPNLTFVACQNTIDRLRVEHGIEVHLIPEAEVIRSGVNHVVKRQKEGWSYIRV